MHTAYRRVDIAPEHIASRAARVALARARLSTGTLRFVEAINIDSDGASGIRINAHAGFSLSLLLSAIDPLTPSLQLSATPPTVECDVQSQTAVDVCHTQGRERRPAIVGDDTSASRRWQHARPSLCAACRFASGAASIHIQRAVVVAETAYPGYISATQSRPRRLLTSISPALVPSGRQSRPALLMPHRDLAVV